MDFVSQNFTAGQLNAIVKKLGGEEAAMRFLRGELTVSAATTTPREFSVWKTVKLGTCKTPDEYRKALKKGSYRIGDWGNDILGKTPCAEEEQEVDLINLTVGELGFGKGASYKDICARAVELGLELCPAEVGPALRLSYKDQPRGEWVVIAMEAITDRDGGLRVFDVDHGGDELWLHGSIGHPDFHWHSDSRFVFVRRK
ncbi:MAG: hypothetical protein WAZ27_04580 [Minisyncoccia bacterium]